MEIDRKLIWIFEDEPGARLAYQETLSAQYSIRFFETINAFLNFKENNLESSDSAQEAPDLILADIELADGNFLDLMGQCDPFLLLACPTIIVSALDNLDVLRSCFQRGVADYLTHPFSKNELLIRIERVLSTLPAKNRRAEKITMDTERLQIRMNESEVAQLTIKEFQILLTLHKNFNESVSRQKLQEAVWGNTVVGAKTLDVHLFNIRKKILKLGLQIEYTAPDSFRLLSKRIGFR